MTFSKRLSKKGTRVFDLCEKEFASEDTDDIIEELAVVMAAIIVGHAVDQDCNPIDLASDFVDHYGDAVTKMIGYARLARNPH